MLCNVNKNQHITSTWCAGACVQTLFTNQFSVTKHHKAITGGLFGEQGLAGVFFIYELSPMMVKYTEKHRLAMSVALLFIVTPQRSGLAHFHAGCFDDM